jgi:hypothetical protein
MTWIVKQDITTTHDKLYYAYNTWSFGTGQIESKLGSNVTLAVFKMLFAFQFLWKFKIAARPITFSN